MARRGLVVVYEMALGIPQAVDREYPRRGLVAATSPPSL